MSYEIVLADPPWSYRDSANAGKRGAVHKYRTLGLPQICALDVHGIAAPNVSWLCGGCPPMPLETLKVVEAWGFTLKTMKGFTWHKTTKHGKSHFGVGHWTRANTEDCLFAVRGKPKRANADVSQFIEAPRGKQSAKPGEVHERLARLMGDVPRLEMFARGAGVGLLGRRSGNHHRRAQEQARGAAGGVRRSAGGEGMTAYQAHREGIRKLREWEDNDFDLARHESRMRLFDDDLE